MRTLPDSWEEMKFIDGYPGEFVIVARKKDNKWYIAGINDITLTDISLSNDTKLSMLPYGGFVIIAEE